MGSEFLSVLFDVSMESSVTQPQKFANFLNRTLSLPMSYASAGRGFGNVGALALAVLPAARGEAEITLREYGVDDAVARGSFPNAKFINVIVSQLDCRGSDLSSVEWDGGKIGSMIADDADLDAFKARSADDCHQFRFIVSLEAVEQLDGLRTYTRPRPLRGHARVDLLRAVDATALIPHMLEALIAGDLGFRRDGGDNPRPASRVAVPKV